MNSRERVLKALRHEEPDRVPLDCGGCRSRTISAVAYSGLKRHLGIEEGTTAVYDVVQHQAMPEQWYLDRFGVDVVDVTREWCLDTANWHDWELPDGSPARIPPWIADRLERDEKRGGWIYRDAEGDVLGRMPPGGHFFDQEYWPLADVDPEEYAKAERYIPKGMWSAIASPLAHLSGDPEYPRLLGEAAKKLYEETDYAILMNAGCNLFEGAQFLRRPDNLLMDLVTDRKNIERLLDRILELNLASLERQLDAAGRYVQIVMVGDDLGTQSAPFISTQMFREVFKPRYRVMYDFIKKKQPGIFIFLHSCGAISPLLGDLIDVGLDIINPVQTSATNMEPDRLKREFGKDITFWGGGADVQSVLPFGTPGDVAAEVEKNLDTLAPGGGFVFAAGHNIGPEVSPENILAMYEAFRQHRNYPIG